MEPECRPFKGTARALWHINRCPLQCPQDTRMSAVAWECQGMQGGRRKDQRQGLDDTAAGTGAASSEVTDFTRGCRCRWVTGMGWRRLGLSVSILCLSPWLP